jgi:hypothetical protein
MQQAINSKPNAQQSLIGLKVDVRGLQIQTLLNQVCEPVNRLLVLHTGRFWLIGFVHATEFRRFKVDGCEYGYRKKQVATSLLELLDRAKFILTGA